jgi:aminomethyltransferase
MTEHAALADAAAGSRAAATSELHTPMHEEHLALGATMTSFAGWQMPLRYTSDLEEHRATRTTAGLFDLTHMGEIDVVGPEAAAALDHALVGAMSRIAIGRAKYTMICQDDGGVIDDLVVYRWGEDHFMVVANASNCAVVVEELRARLHGFDVVLTDESLTTALLAVQGPRAEAIATAVVDDPVDAEAVRALRYYAAVPITVAGVRTRVARTGYTGEDGFELFVSTDDAVTVWHALRAAGEPHGLVPAGLSARDSLRLEAGMPLYGQELDRTTTPYDAGLGRVVALDKPGDFVGKKTLRARAESEPARLLVGLEGLTRRAARTGYEVLMGPDGPHVGVVTSGAPSPTLGHPIAMAYVTPEVSAPGMRLAVDVRGRAEEVRVVALPFYRRP